MNIQENHIEKLSYIYLLISLLLFFVTWLNPLFSIICATALIIIFYILLKERKTDADTINIKRSYLVIIGLISLLWSFLAGIGGLYYQSSDWHIRNAIFRDLINFSYPVIYENGSALIYYIGQMLPAAIVGKICNYSGIIHSYTIANIFNLLWSSLGIFLIIVNIFNITKNSKFWIVAILLLFSGMDILNTNLDSLLMLHIERHSFYQYSSNTTLLFWVYNQTIAVWLVILNLIKNRDDLSKFGLYAILLLYYSPLPFIGTIFYFLTFVLVKLIKSVKNTNLKQFAKEVFSVTNLLSVLIILPVICSYYKCNDNNLGDMIGTYIYNMESFRFYFRFVICEAGLLLLLMMYRYYKNILFIIMTLHLFIIPILSIPSAPDFCMRASIPSLFILMVFIIKFLSDTSTKKILKILVIICLFIGTITPIFEVGRGIILMKYNIEPPVKDEIITLNNKITDDVVWELLTEHDYIRNFGSYRNYGTINPQKYVFFKYLARH